MEQPTQKQEDARQKLIKSVLDAGSKAFNPREPESSRSGAIQEFENIIRSTKTLNLIPALNLLLRQPAIPPWLRERIKDQLARVPLRLDGVRGSLEFIFSVHPSSTVNASEAAVPQKWGANITHESLQLASSLLSNPPRSVTLQEWYSATGPQLLALLDGGAGPELVKVASYVIGFGILGKKTSGLPGTDGWKFFAEPILNHIKPPPGFSVEASNEAEDIVDLSSEETLVRANDLSTALHRLRTLLMSHPNPGLSKRLIHRLLLQIWALASWPEPGSDVSEKVCTPAKELLRVYMQLVPSSDLILLLVRRLGYVGGYNESDPEWVYAPTKDGQIQIVASNPSIGKGVTSVARITFQDIDRKVSALLDLVRSTHSDADISAAFIELLKRWLQSSSGGKEDSIRVKQEEDARDPMIQLVETKALQAMMERFSETLATQPKHILDLAGQILSGSADNPDSDDDVTGIALSLLNMIITAPGFQKSHVNPDLLTLIESSLDKLSESTTSISQTATNLRLLLLYRDEVDSTTSTSATTAPTTRQIEDRKTYNLAISYITSPDSPPPVRSEGLSLIASLIKSHSPILDIPGVLVLLSKFMSDSDEYIYLRVINLYTLLATNHHPRSVVRELTDHFLDLRETYSLDARLRFAEALSQVIQRLGDQFTGTLAIETGTALLSVAGRRARRPKTEARQLREAKLQEKRDKEAAEEWGGAVPDFSEPASSADEKAVNELLERIVGGWESKRGEEDVRVRASALAVLGTAVEINLEGVGREVARDAVDLCVVLVSLEREPEKGILRRAAVRFVLSFVRALEEAREKGREFGFGFGAEAQEQVMRTLRYVAETDNDGLAVQHARDVVESLENWQVIKLLPAEGTGPGAGLGGLTKLAGLAVDPERSAAGQGSSKPKPRIEEIE